MSILELNNWCTTEEQTERVSAEDWLVPLHQRMSRVFEEFLNEDLPCRMKIQRNGCFSPDIDVSETRLWVVVTAELPGIHEEEIVITLSDSVLTIRGEKLSKVSTVREDGEEERNHSRERIFGAFERSLELPSRIDPDRVSATIDLGILTIIVGKRESMWPDLRPSGLL